MYSGPCPIFSLFFWRNMDHFSVLTILLHHFLWPAVHILVFRDNRVLLLICFFLVDAEYLLNISLNFQITSTAGGGTLTLEFGILSRLTNDPSNYFMLWQYIYIYIYVFLYLVSVKMLCWQFIYISPIRIALEYIRDLPFTFLFPHFFVLDIYFMNTLFLF